MKILVCISNVPDTTTKIRFNAEKTEFDKAGVQWIINPWDELALTRALELKEGSGGAVESVDVASVNLVDAEPTIRKALAIGADKAFRVNAMRLKMPILLPVNWPRLLNPAVTTLCFAV
jgi:electron transfer flavoprotein beta subunit